MIQHVAGYIVIMCFSIITYCQEVPASLKFTNPVSTSDSNELSISYSTLFYFKDYEYSKSRIQTGYTSFGTWHYPRISLQPSKNFRIEAGAALQKEFGELHSQDARILFSVKYRPHKNTQLSLGALEGALSHNLVQPLMGYDRVIERPFEEGFQFKHTSQRITVDAWLDWQVRQELYGNYPEELTAGLSMEYLLSDPQKRWQFKIPFQLLAPHRGGQLDTSGVPVSTVLNTAVGVIAEKNNQGSNDFLQRFRADAYYVGYKLFHESNSYPYDAGHGFLINTVFDTKKNFSLLLTYWKGTKFIAPFGAPIFQSVSYHPRNPGYTETERQLLLVNLFYEKEIFTNAFMHASFNPYLDLQRGHFENAFGLYFSYRNNFRLGKIKK